MLAALTRGGARAMRRARPARPARAGYAADLILLDLDTPAFTPLNDLRRQLVFCEDGSSVRFTVVAGRVVYEDGRVTAIDEKAIRAEARALMAGYRATLARAGREARRASSPTTARCTSRRRSATSASAGGCTDRSAHANQPMKELP